MGYTHYWTNSSTKVPKSVVELFKKKVCALKVVDQVPIIFDANNADQLWFNGVDDDAHETMCFDFTGDGCWQFCKTARKPYDALVVASLWLAEEMGIVVGFSSDGEDSSGDFNEAKRLFDSIKDIEWELAE